MLKDSKRREKGQSGLEYLMTYGWAFLVIIIALGAIIYYVVAEPQRLASNSLTLPAGFSAYSYKIRGDKLFADIGQATGKTIIVSGVICTKNESVNRVENINVKIPHGQHAYISNGTITCDNAVPGEVYKGRVFIWYSYQASNATHTVIGDLTCYPEQPAG